MRAVIIGAGIAGPAVAKGLRLLGWETEIYEQASEQSRQHPAANLKGVLAVSPRKVGSFCRKSLDLPVTGNRRW
ncbi:hypothetical protein [Mesorhizobium sp.]|uniref:hypothetical protein n=1 Tax=Mesorhizobium sp. TaxID=1871066 RepID=UPI000FE5FCA2|nr:hypothetical protein [Mesorhizobium sp.]RWP36126.1 MAG: hypothetical protein EOR03_10715 [Mesorhizobium sp.]TIL66311.1 MAG: hypothetical protein E5Y77_17380 [Mesorhizobium sp.]